MSRPSLYGTIRESSPFRFFAYNPIQSGSLSRGRPASCRERKSPPMRPYREILEDLDRLWTLAQTQAERYFTSPSPESPPSDLKDLNTAATLLKRIQDARRALNLDALKLEALSSHAVQAAPQGPDADDSDRVSRILERFLSEEREESGTGESPEGDDSRNE